MAFEYIGNGAPSGLPIGEPAAYLDKTNGVAYTSSDQGWHMLLLSSQDALTAHGSGGQASGTQLTARISRVTTVTSGGDSVKLPTAVPGMVFIVANAHASNSMDCFPATDGYINALAKDGAFAIASGKTALFACAKAAYWSAILTA